MVWDRSRDAEREPASPGFPPPAAAPRGFPRAWPRAGTRPSSPIQKASGASLWGPRSWPWRRPFEKGHLMSLCVAPLVLSPKRCLAHDKWEAFRWVEAFKNESFYFILEFFFFKTKLRAGLSCRGIAWVVPLPRARGGHILPPGKAQRGSQGALPWGRGEPSPAGK